MNSKSILTFAAAALILAACSSKVYNNTSYVRQHDLTGKKIAVLPVDVQFTGRLPKGYSVEKKYAEEEKESLAIQNLVYSEYLYNASGSTKRGAVTLINTDQVNSRLASLGIEVRESWNMDPDSLGRLVGADLVLKIRVKKNRIMSESAAFGLDVAGSVIDKLLTRNTTNTGSVSPGNTKTYTINVNATLSDAKTHEVITKFSREGEASWSQSPESVVRSSGKKIVKKGVVFAAK